MTYHIDAMAGLPKDEKDLALRLVQNMPNMKTLYTALVLRRDPLTWQKALIHIREDACLVKAVMPLRTRQQEPHPLSQDPSVEGQITAVKEWCDEVENGLDQVERDLGNNFDDVSAIHALVYLRQSCRRKLPDYTTPVRRVELQTKWIYSMTVSAKVRHNP